MWSPGFPLPALPFSRPALQDSGQARSLATAKMAACQPFLGMRLFWGSSWNGSASFLPSYHTHTMPPFSACQVRMPGFFCRRHHRLSSRRSDKYFLLFLHSLVAGLPFPEESCAHQPFETLSFFFRGRGRGGPPAAAASPRECRRRPVTPPSPPLLARAVIAFSFCLLPLICLFH